MAKLVRILVADDHAVVRAGLRALLERQSNLRIVAEAATGEEAIAQARDYRPDIAILDIRMPGISGIEACRQILEQVRVAGSLCLQPTPRMNYYSRPFAPGPPVTC